MTVAVAEKTMTPRRRQIAMQLNAIEAEIARRNAPARIEASLPDIVKPLLKPARYKGLHGGRGGMKSHTFARLLIAKALREPGLRWLCGREIQLSLKESVKLLLEDTIELFNVGDRFVVKETHIETPGDGKILFLGLQNHTVQSIKSLERLNGTWIEEAQSLSANSLKMLRPTLREDDSELWFSWNPEKPTDPIDDLLRGAVPPSNSIVIEVNYQDNPHFPKVLREEMETDYARDPESAAHVWGGKYAKRSKASVFKNWHVGKFTTPPDAMFMFGGDWGFSVDPTVLVRSFIAQGEFLKQMQAQFGVGDNVLCIDAAVYEVGCEIDDTPALFDNIDPAHRQMARNWKIKADSARPETISYMQRHGYRRIEAARKGAGSVEEGVKFLQSYDIIVHSSCCSQCGDGKNHVEDELINYKFKVDKLTGNVLPILEDKKNHVIDAVRYSVEDVSKPKETFLW